jgi:hypothetical protein
MMLVCMFRDFQQQHVWYFHTEFTSSQHWVEGQCQTSTDKLTSCHSQVLLISINPKREGENQKTQEGRVAQRERQKQREKKRKSHNERRGRK